MTHGKGEVACGPSPMAKDGKGERKRHRGKTHEKEAGGGVGRTVKENSDYQDQRLVAYPMFL